jgi:hypothetical protein
MLKRESDFTTDKYNKPTYLSKRDSVAQLVENALFSKEGNFLSHPDRYVDIEQYLGRSVDSVDELKILSDLKRTIGEGLIGNDVKSLTFNVVTMNTTDGGTQDVALIVVGLSIDNTDDLMAIGIQRDKDNTVRYNYSFINEDVPV